MAKLTTEQIKDRAKVLLAEANNTLKVTGCAMRLEVKGDSLCIRGVLPSRNSDRAEPYRQRLALGLKMSPVAIAKAQAIAQKISFDLESDRFKWEDYISDSKSSKTCGQVIGELEEKFKPDLKPSTWEFTYLQYYNRLPQDAMLTADLLMTTYNQIEAKHKRARQMCAAAFKKIAEVAGIEINFTPVKRSKADLSKRDIPSNELIVKIHSEIKSSTWQFAFGLLATYGLRPHELEFADFSEMPVLNITEGKTGARRVYPLPAEWVELFDLQNPSKKLPPINSFGRQTHLFFSRNKIPFVPYDLRHAYAIRGTVTKKISLPVMARMMGHAPEVHLKTYNSWIKDSHVDDEMSRM
jgi:integrase